MKITMIQISRYPFMVKIELKKIKREDHTFKGLYHYKTRGS